MSEYLTPIIDRDIFFGNPEIAGGKISPDRKFISFLKPYNGIRNIWVKKFDEPFESARPITADQSRPIASYFWSRDGRYILYVQDKGGDENFHVYAVKPDVSINNKTGVPDSKDLTPYEGIRAIIMQVPKSDHSALFVGINDRDNAWHDLYKVNIENGERELILRNDIQFSSAVFDLNDEIQILTRTTQDGGQEFLKLDGNEWIPVYSHSNIESASPSGFTKDGRMYLVSDKGDDVDLSQLLLLDIHSSELEFVESDPEGKVDFGGALFSDLTETLIATTYTAEKTKVYWLDKEFEKDYKMLEDRFEGAEVSFTSGTKDEMTWITYINKDTDPGAAYLFDRRTKETKFLYRPRPNLPIDHLVEMKAVSYKSSDGLDIPAYLSLPKTGDSKGLPAIIMPHGGPWARDYWGYNSYAQFLANRGYAVLMSNFRGSIGYGKSFQNAANLQWGEKMQDDLTWGAKFLIENEIADPKRIAILGGSYGGYATLAGLTFTPDVYAAGVSIVGPSNLFTLLETIPPYWASALKIFHTRMGNPETEEGKEQLRRQSPYFHANEIKAPLLVAQGDNDPRVKTSESNQIVVACRESGQDVQYLNFPDEGHGFANPDNSMAFLAVTEKFLSQHIGGRYQKNIPERLQKIIDKVNVEISKVKI